MIAASPQMEESLQSSVPPCRRHCSQRPNDLEQVMSTLLGLVLGLEKTLCYQHHVSFIIPVGKVNCVWVKAEMILTRSPLHITEVVIP